MSKIEDCGHLSMEDTMRIPAIWNKREALRDYSEIFGQGNCNVRSPKVDGNF